LDAAALTRFHASHADGLSAYSTCMHRQDAATLSFSHIRVMDGCADFFFSPAAPCQSSGLIRRFLPLSAVRSRPAA
jgi:hypothetical protein